MKNMFKLSKKLQLLPPYLFVEIDKAKRRTRQAGRDIIDLGVGDPDLPTPPHIIKKLYEAACDPSTHRYALDQGTSRLRQAIARWYKTRFNVDLDPDSEILPLIGSKEGIAHFPLAFLNPGNYSLVPDPGYPPYKGGTILAGGRPYLMPLRQTYGFLPDLKEIPLNIRRKAKLLYINYPNNPTAATAESDFYLEVVEFSRKNRIIVISDLAYSEIVYDAYRPTSFLAVEGARESGIEFHSLSKTYNMTGWRIGFACGNKKLIAALTKVKSNIDSGIFTAIQIAGIAALEGPQGCISNMRRIYKERRDILVEGLTSLGWGINIPKATFYLWIKIPNGVILRSDSSGSRRETKAKTSFGIPLKYDSIKFSKILLEKANIVVTPGIGFGRYGEGYIRMAFTVDKERIKEAIGRLNRLAIFKL